MCEVRVSSILEAAGGCGRVYKSGLVVLSGVCDESLESDRARHQLECRLSASLPKGVVDGAETALVTDTDQYVTDT